MSSKYRQKRDEGFTIIEVLIVLAIAGLIMLVVFLAIPALQRNQRNTRRDSDVSNILSGVGEYVNNNNGQLPGGVSTDGTTLTIGESGNTVPVNLGFYGEGEVTLTGDVPGSNTSTESTVIIVTGAQCGSGENANEAVDGPSRAYVALYTKESDAQQCQAS